LAYLLLVIGFILLIKGADLFVDGSSSLAKTLRIPAVIIGLTIVAMGTSAPEASVSINAALAGNNDIALSNVVGSNIFNGMVVVGICAMIVPFTVDPSILKRDLYVNIAIAIILAVMMIDLSISRLEGIILLALMVCYIGSMVVSALKNREEQDEIKVMPLPQSLLFIAIGLAMVVFGGDMVVDNASVIATQFGLSQNFIGLTIVAIGTSLPELVTSIVAAKKGESGLALGNAVGSNIFNILFILGMSATVSPLVVLSESLIDVVILIVTCIVLFIFARTKKSMGHKEGLVTVSIYVAYMIYLFIR
jgi:cation:H+ antiporter